MKTWHDQKGFTMIELLVALTISVFIGTLLGTSTSMFYRVTGSGNDKFRAFHAVRNAARIISLDTHMATTTDLVDGALPVSGVTMQWTDESTDPPSAHISVYQLSPGGDLSRNYDDSGARVIARDIQDIGFSLCGNELTVDITAAPLGGSGVSEQYSYTILMRSSDASPCP